MTILTDEEVASVRIENYDACGDWIDFARAIEASVIEKLKQQEPVAWNYELENDAFRRAYTLGFKADTPLYAAPLPDSDVEKQRDDLLAALELWLDIHDNPVGFGSKYGKSLTDSIAAQEVKVNAAASAARTAIARVKGGAA